MAYRTINLKPSTYEKLLRYKHMGMTFDEIIDDILEEVDSTEMYQRALREHKKRLKAINEGEYITLEELKKKLKVS